VSPLALSGHQASARMDLDGCALAPAEKERTSDSWTPIAQNLALVIA
jgi:hypothetical protein